MNDNTDDIKTQLAHYIVGVSGAELPFSTSKENALIAAHMAKQAQQRIDIISRDLDHKIYSDADFNAAVLHLIKTNNKAEIRILIHESRRVNLQHHRLVDLFQKFDSFISIKRIHHDYKNYNHAVLLIDNAAIIFREYADLYDGIANYDNKKLVKQMQQEFTTLWEISEPETSLRKLMI